DAPLQRYFPDWQGPHKELVTIRHLITHTSGLPAFRAYDQQTHDADSVARLMFSTPLDTLPGVRMVYSDIGAYMLGRLVERVARMYLNGGVLDGARIVGPATIDRFATRQVADRALGWQKPDGSNSAGHLMSERAFGHTGFTGTSIWIDPDHDVFVLLLSNRV